MNAAPLTADTIRAALGDLTPIFLLTAEPVGFTVTCNRVDARELTATARRRLEAAGLSAFPLGYGDLHVALRADVTAEPWTPPCDDVEEEDAPDTDREPMDDDDTEVDDAPLFVTGIRSPRGFEDARIGGAW